MTDLVRYCGYCNFELRKYSIRNGYDRSTGEAQTFPVLACPFAMNTETSYIVGSSHDIYSRGYKFPFFWGGEDRKVWYLMRDW